MLLQGQAGIRARPVTGVQTCAPPISVSEVLLTTVTFVAAVPPRLTVAPAAKPGPVRVTAVPPLLVPELGEIALTVGAGLFPTRRSSDLPLWPSELVTTTSTAPAAWAAVVAVSEVLLTTVTFVAAVPPRLTVAPAAKPVPARVPAVPPLLVPELGEIALTVGAGLV